MNRDLIDKVREANDIIDVIGSYIPLKKTGANFKTRCPFHDEKTASFVVSPQKQIFKCFGCGEAGNVISFVQKYERISFIETVKKLAKRSGINLPSSGKKYKKTKNDLLFKIYSLTHSFFQENLEKYGNSAQDYLINRDFDLETIKKYELGYALNSFSALSNYLRRNHINDQILEISGLVKKNQNGFYDIFRDRIMFPIHSISGKIVAFGGRVFTEEFKGGKYINSPTTKIYTKGDQLYGLYFTRYDIGKLDSALICEGYMDFLRLVENGFNNSVAALGTSLTAKQIKLLSRYTKNYYLLFDGDKAGKKAALRSAKLVTQEGLDAKIVVLPDGEDPDSVIVKEGKDVLQKYIDSAKNIVDFLYEDKSLEMDTRKKLDFFVGVLQNINDSIKKQLLLRQIAETFQISEQAIYKKIRPVRQENKEVKEQKLEIFKEEELLLKYLLNHPSKINYVANEVKDTYIFTDVCKTIFERIIKVAAEDTNLVPADFFDFFQEEILRNYIGKLVFDETEELFFDDIVNLLKVRKNILKIKEINNKIKTYSKDAEMFNQLLTQKIMLKSKIKKIINNANTKLIDIRGINAEL